MEWIFHVEGECFSNGMTADASNGYGGVAALNEARQCGAQIGLNLFRSDIEFQILCVRTHTRQ